MRICAFVNYVCHYKVVHWHSASILQSLEGLKVWTQSIWILSKLSLDFPKPWAFCFVLLFILETALCHLGGCKSTPE